MKPTTDSTRAIGNCLSAVRAARTSLGRALNVRLRDETQRQRLNLLRKRLRDSELELAREVFLAEAKS